MTSSFDVMLCFMYVKKLCMLCWGMGQGTILWWGQASYTKIAATSYIAP